MKDLKKLTAECERDLLSIGIQPGKVRSWIINTRSKCRWGQCKTVLPGLYDISISERLLRDEVDVQAAKNTILHELLHTVKGCCGHKGLWKELANKVNRMLPQYNIKRTTSSEEKGIEPIRRIHTNRYTVRCVKCGKEYHRERKSKLILHLEKYRCGMCNSPLERVK